jgi:hypothetical protein
MSSRQARRLFAFIAVVFGALMIAAAVGVAPSAAKGPPHPPGEEGEETSNNLSVPAIFVPNADSFTSVVCTIGDDSADPSGPMGVDTNNDGILDEHLDYYVQGVATWQSDCDPAATALAAAAWGDNLKNAPLRARTPVRVEIGFLADGVQPMPGYTVVKLDPTLLDRESHYGTFGVKEFFSEVRVWEANVRLDIIGTDGRVEYGGEFKAEINSTGRVVYGYNWRPDVAGDYTITATVTDITITSVDAGTLGDDGKTVSIDVTVGNKGGGGGGNGGRPDDPPGKGGKGGGGGGGGGNG